MKIDNVVSFFVCTRRDHYSESGIKEGTMTSLEDLGASELVLRCILVLTQKLFAEEMRGHFFPFHLSLLSPLQYSYL